MTIKPAGKIAIVVVVVVGAFFLLKPLILGKEYKNKIEVKDSTVHVIDTPTVSVPVVTPTAPTEFPRNTVKEKKPVVKKEVKKVEPKKKKKERENLDIEF